MGGMSLGGQLKRLEEDYDLIKKKRPILSKEGSQTVRYEVSDMFLRFWFRYFIKYQNYIEIQNFERLADIIKKGLSDILRFGSGNVFPPTDDGKQGICRYRLLVARKE